MTSLLVIAPAACGGDDNNSNNNNSGSSGSSSSGSSSSSSGSSSSGGLDTGVTGTAKNTYKTSTGEVVIPSGTWTSIEAEVGEGAAQKSYPGSIDAEGNISIPDVPVGPYRLVLTSAPPANNPSAKPFKTVIETDARSLELGYVYSYRADIKSATKPTLVTIDANLSVPWQAYTEDGQGKVTQPLDDSLQFVAQDAAVWSLWISPGSPMNGDTKITGWTEDAMGMFSGTAKVPFPLIEGNKGDQLTILHNVTQMVGAATPDGNPWNGHQFMSAQEYLQPASFTMTDGGTSKLSGDFKPIPQTMFAMDFKVSAFTDMLKGVPSTTSYAEMVVFREPGAPEPATGTYAVLLDVSVTPGTAYTNQNPACQGAGCDPAACGAACDPGVTVLPGDYAHTYSYGDPFTDGQALLGVIFYSWNNVTQLLPEKTSEWLRCRTNAIGPAAEGNGKPIVPAVGFPKAITIAGKDAPYDQITSGVGVTPVISWSAPTIGSPTHYEVSVIDLTDVTLADGSVEAQRQVANIHTTGTSVAVPDGVMEPGRSYSFEVSAYVREGDNLAAPFHYAQRESFAQMFTGVVTP